MSQVVFKVLQKTIMPFPVLFELVKDNERITQDLLAEALIKIGITVTYALYTVISGEGTEKLEESEPKREYISALASYDIPVGILYQTISKVLQTNYSKRIGGALPDGFNLRKILVQKQADKAPVINMSQYSSKSNQAKMQEQAVAYEPVAYKPPVQAQAQRGGSADVVVGYSAKKKYNAPVVVKSLWDEDTSSAFSNIEQAVENDKVVLTSAPQNTRPLPVQQPAVQQPAVQQPAVQQPAPQQQQPAEGDAPVVAYSGRKKYQPAQVGSLW